MPSSLSGTSSGQSDSPAAFHHTHAHPRHGAASNTAVHAVPPQQSGRDEHSIDSVPLLGDDSSRRTKQGSLPFMGGIKVMGLDPSPELLAISMGKQIG